ncbi:hypothetical protein BGZ73_008817, partial [Actinomortierella ambigua]
FVAQFRFKPKLDDKRYCKHWVWANPPLGLVMPGQKTSIHITVMVDNETAPMLNRGRDQLDDILILHMEYGKDYFISVSGNYVRTCFGNSLEWLARLDRPVRLWDPEDEEDAAGAEAGAEGLPGEDDWHEEDSVVQPLDPQQTLKAGGGHKAASGAVDPQQQPMEDGEAFVVGDDEDFDGLTRKEDARRASSVSQPVTPTSSKAPSSLLSMTTLDGGGEAEGKPLKRSNSTNSSHGTKASATAATLRRRSATTGGGASGGRSKEQKQKRRSVRQLSIPRDLWRIVDFIYKHGIYVDNLFMLSGDQATMRYIRECLDTGEEFDVERLLSSSGSTDAEKEQERERERASLADRDAAAPGEGANDEKQKGKKSKKQGGKKDDDHKEEEGDEATTETEESTISPAKVAPSSSSSQPASTYRAMKGQAGSSLLSPRGSHSDLRPQIARPISIINGLPPRSALFFGQGEHMGMHSMAEVLLLFLDSLSEPVVPMEMYYRALEVCNDRQACYGLLDLMPPVNVNVFVYLTSFLREIVLLNHARQMAGSGGGDAESATTGSTPTPSIIVASSGGGASESIASSSGGGASSSATTNVERTGSIYNGNDGASIMSTSRARREAAEDDHRVAKLASVFSKVMLRPPAGSERLSDIETLKKKRFLMHFLHEPKDDERASNSDMMGLESSGPAGAGRAGSGTISTKGSRGSLNDKWSN